MERHRGELVERIVRKNNINISYLASQLGVSRSKIYEWFGKKQLNPEIIVQVGKAINYNFINDFPELFSQREKQLIEPKLPAAKHSINSEMWKDKYIVLLEKFNQMLAN